MAFSYCPYLNVPPSYGDASLRALVMAFSWLLSAESCSQTTLLIVMWENSLQLCSKVNYPLPSPLFFLTPFFLYLPIWLSCWILLGGLCGPFIPLRVFFHGWPINILEGWVGLALPTKNSFLTLGDVCGHLVKGPQHPPCLMVGMCRYHRGIVSNPDGSFTKENIKENKHTVLISFHLSVCLLSL